MSTTGTEVAHGRVARKIVADALRLNWAGLEPAFALRCAAGVAIPLLASAAAGAPLAGASAAYGALVAGIASRQGVYRTRVAVMLTASAVLAVSGFAGALTGPVPALNIALLAVWTLCFGVVSSLGRSATVVAVNACVAYVVFSNPPYDAANPGFQALMVFAGGLIQMLLLVLVWPLDQFRAERSTLAAAYASLARYASALRVEDLGLPDSQTLAAAGAALADPQPFGSRAEIAAYQSLADEAERLRATLAALATDGHLLNDVGHGELARAVSDAGHAAGPLLQAVSDAVAAGRAPSAGETERRRLDAALFAIEQRSSDHAPYAEDARALAGQVRAALRSAAAAASGGLALAVADQPVTPKPFVNLGAMAQQVWANCSWSSSYARHAVRLTVTLTVAAIAQHLLPLAHAQWIGLTVVLVLRPDFASTFARGVARVVGTVAGAILASAIAAFHPSGSLYIGLAIAFAAISFALFNVSYALYSVAITGYIVYLLAFGGAPEHASALDRVVATVIGGLLALVAYAAWPAWTHARVADDLADLIDGLRRYLDRVLLSFVNDGGVDEAALRAAQTAVWRARSNAEAAVDSMAGEPVRPRGLDAREAAGILAATRRLGIAGLTLHARVTRVAGATHDLIEGFAAGLDVALRALVEALRSDRAAEPLPRLRDDHEALQRALDERGDPAVQVLVSESDLIVDAVNSIAAILERHAATEQPAAANAPS